MLVNAEGHVFVGQRKDSPTVALQMPQGGIDPGETPRQAALRELTEETGVAPDLVEVIAESDKWIRYNLPEDLIGKLWNGKYQGQEQKWVLMRFLGTDADVNINTAEPEFSHWEWLPVENLVAQIVPFKRAVYEQVLAAFAPHLK